MGFDVDKPKGGAKVKISKKRTEQIEQYIEEIDDNVKQFARELKCLYIKIFDDFLFANMKDR